MGDKPRRKRDLLYIHGPLPEKKGFGAIRARADRVDLGFVRPLKDGEAVDGEIVKLTRRKEHEQLFDAETVASADELTGKPANGGPPQVANDEFRRNWDATFKPRRRKRSLLN